MIKLTYEEVAVARDRWYKFWGREAIQFWRWMKREEYPVVVSSTYVLMHPEQARRIRMLNSEHWFTLLKAAAVSEDADNS